MKRWTQRSVVGLTSLACVACLIAWPTSCRRVFTFFYFGESKVVAVELRSGRLGFLLEHGPAIAEAVRHQDIPSPGTHVFNTESNSGFGWNRESIWNSLRFEAVREATTNYHGLKDLRRGIVIPLWFPIIATALAPMIAVRRYLIRRRRTQTGLCAVCGYDLRATSGRCTECGTVIETCTTTAG